MAEHSPRKRSPRSSWGPLAYASGLALSWVALLILSGDRARLRTEDTVGYVVLFAVAIVSLRARDPAWKGAANSFTTVILLTCLVLFGPLAASVLGVVVAFSDRTYGLSIVSFFNATMIAVMTATGGLVYHAVGGSPTLPGAVGAIELVRQVGLPLLAADLTMCAINILTVAGMIFVTGGNARTLVIASLRELVPLFLGYALVAFVFVLLWGPAGVGPLSAVLISAPLAIARFVYIQYGDELRAHDRIVGMFTRAGDGPDGRVAAHAARVSELCQMMAGQLGLGEHDRQTLTYAAHLHDIAMKAVVRATDTQRGGSGPYTNVRALVPHPALAAEVVAGVHFLAEAAVTIRAHHERMDGRGYPDGLVGEDIPLTARILAVADAFDALTTTRGARTALDPRDALAELQLSAGTHLDPRVLDSLAAALRSRSWPVHDDPLHEGSWLWDHHTLPAMSDVIADELPAAHAADESVAAESDAGSAPVIDGSASERRGARGGVRTMRAGRSQFEGRPR